ncbi:MAG: PQQ-dependent sugar dehydrogenase [Candidatus Daviesbacteria bacterium]|nr:PQQ-dependent sugar dehydrogenase [Candidatus Daviesbacteria bacterium]
MNRLITFLINYMGVNFLLLFIILMVFLVTGVVSPAFALPPADFDKIKVIGNLQDPTAFRFAPNGDIYIALQSGQIVILRGGVLLPTPVISLNADSFNEKGLLGMELDPNFAANGYIYVSYTSLADGFARISRITVVNDIADSSSEVMFGQSNQTADIFHNANDVRVGPDGKIWWLIGDNLQPANSQSLSNVHGKVHRFDMDLSSANDNPWHGKSGQGITDSIYALGLRNPFRMTFLPNGKAITGDVGSNISEEFNVVEPGANFGWPNVEGDCGACGYANPIYSYVHGGFGAAVTGMAIYNGTAFPSQFQNVLFYGDYAKGVIRYLVFDESYGSVLSDNSFDDDAGTVVDIHQGPDGNLYYLGIFEKTLWKIIPAGGNRTPIAQASADPIAGLAPLIVNFSSSGSLDPDGTPLAYNWDFGDTTTSTDANPIHTYNTNGTYNVVLTVSDGEKTAQAAVTVTVGNELPNAEINTPIDAFKYNAGWQIDFSGLGTDPEDGNLPDSAFSWTIVFHHAQHIHPFEGPFNGIKNGSFVIPFNIAQEHDTWYRIELTVTDSAGLKRKVTRDIFPNLAQLTIQSNVAGTQFLVDGKLYTEAFTSQEVVGVNHGVAALTPQFIGTDKYRFESWSDGGAAIHTIVVPETDSIFTVNYRLVTPPPPPWQAIDVGNPALFGNTDFSLADNSFYIEGAGWDIWDMTDQFHYMYQNLDGNGEIIARITSLSNIDPFTKVGLMIKESIAPLSSYAMVALTPINGTLFQYNFNGSQGGLEMPYTLPAWAKLVREGNKFTSYISPDGINWTLVGTKTFEMNAQTTVGIFVNSHNGGKLATANFDNVSVNDVLDPPNTPPTALNQIIFTPQDRSVDLTLAAIDPDAGRLAHFLTVNPTHGIVAGTAPQFSYTPEVGFVGTDSFSFKSNDGFSDSNEATISAQVTTAVEPMPAPWTNLDIGSPLMAGSAEFAGGMFFIKGGGDDIWQGVTPDVKVDQFHFVQQPFSEDGEIVARISSQTYTDEWAKAGVMIKESNTAGAPYVMMATTPGNGFAFQSDFISDIHGDVYSFPEAWVKLKRIGNTFVAYKSSDGANWIQVGSKTLAMNSNAVAGMFVTSHNGSALSRVTFDNVSVNGVSVSPLPAPWLSSDVGNPEIAGSASFENDKFIVNGAGIDVWDVNDQFHFVYQGLSGDGEIVSRVLTQTNTNPDAKAGIMIKESTEAFSPYAFLSVTPTNGVRFQYNFNGELIDGTSTYPVWLKLKRFGTTITAYSSVDGLNWTEIGATNIAMPANALVGLAVTSHDPLVLGTAEFDNVSVTKASALPQPWQNTDVGFSLPGGSASFEGEIFTVNGGGNDIWGTTDEFHYAYQYLSGDIEFIAKVNSQTNTDPWAKSGLMIKQSTSALSPYVLLAVTPENGVHLQSNFVSDIGGGPYSFPVWLKLKRVGDLFTAYTSADGVIWTEVGSTTLAMSPNATLGLAVNSHNGSLLNTTQFENVTILDVSSPVVSITNPLDGSVVEPGTIVNITADATDNLTITNLEFYVDDALLGTDNSAPYEIAWDTTNLSGPHTIFAKAYDSEGNIGTSSTITASVEPPIEVFSDSFETTVPVWGANWTEDAQGDWFQSTQRATNGATSAEVDGIATDAQLISNDINMQGRTQADISFSWFIEPTLDLGEYLAFDVSEDGGVTWTEKAKLQGDIDLENSWHAVNVQMTNVSSLKLRFRANMNESAEDADVDNVKVMAGVLPPPDPVLYSESFEVTTPVWGGNWAEDAQGDWFQSTQRATNGSFSAEVDGLATDAQLISSPIDLQGNNSATVLFSWLIEPTLDLGEYIAFDISTDGGVTWNEKAKLQGDIDLENSWQDVSLELINIPNLQFRFRAFMNESAEDADVDNIRVLGKNVTPPPGNTAPVADNQNLQTNEDVALPITLTATDLDGQTLNYSIVTPPANGVLTGTAPNLTYTPNANFSGADLFSFKANDGFLDSNVATVNIDVLALNDNPNISSSAPTAAFVDTLYSYDVEAQDPDADSLVYSLTISPLGMSIDSSTGLIQWIPLDSQQGDHSVVVNVIDNNGGSADQSYTLAVTPLITDPLEVFSDSFETTVPVWGGQWAEDAQGDWFQSTQRATNGSFSAEVDGLATDAQLISNTIDLQGRSQATITYSWFIEPSLDLGDYIAFDVSEDGGVTWTEKAKLQGDVDTENVWHDVSIEVVGATNLKLRFRGNMVDGVEDADVDNVKVTAGILPPPPPILFSDSFENGQWNGLWIEDVQNDWLTSTQRATNGSFSAEVDGLATNATITSIPVDLQGNSDVTISFSWLIESTLDLGEYLAFDVSTDGGATWVEMAKLDGDVDTENIWHSESITLNGISSLQIRFRASMDAGTEDADVDMVKITAP